MESGTRLGPYEILEQLGAGGMGEVWLAEDSRLGRKVAIKVLPEEFASDPERLARFEQEARAAAALNHPHIAAIYDVGSETTVDGKTTRFMVQEYLQGDSLRAVLEQGQPPLLRTLELSIEISEALAAAHRAGIVHRDLKPDNVFVSEDGHAKVLDFGLAKLIEMAGGPAGDQSMSPTLLGTQAGAIMGTAGYMAPEQVNAQDVDARADIFAFGCLLYEMASGKRAFAGESLVQTLNRIAHEEPEPLRDLDEALPGELQRIVRKCLAKSPDRRYQTAADLTVDLLALGADVEAGRASPQIARIDGSVEMPNRTRWAAAAIGGLLLGAASMWVLAPTPTAPPNGPAHFYIELPGNVPGFDNTNQQVMAISPDGQRIAFVGLDQLWLRTLDEQEPIPFPAADEPRSPAFSPSSDQIAFWAGGQIKRVAVNGGTPVVVGSSPGRPQGVTWGNDGYIYVGAADGRAIVRLPENGGQPESVLDTSSEAAELRAYGPRLLPGGEWLMFTQHTGGNWDTAQIVALSLETDERRLLLAGGHDARYVPTGHLVYVTGGVLLAVRFDLDSLEVAGGPVPLLENVRTSAGGASGAAYYSVADNGNIAYISGSSSGDVRLQWIDRDGRTELMPIEPGRFGRSLQLSPDGERIAVEVLEAAGDHIWLYDVDRSSGQRLSTEPNSEKPVWSPDGEWVYFNRRSSVGADTDIWRRRADLSLPAELVLQADGVQVALAISHDGEWLYYTHAVTASSDIYRVNLRDPGEPEPMVTTPASEFGGKVSPDGRFLLFRSNETGRDELFVLEIETGVRWRISEDGSADADWSPTTQEILMRVSAGIMSVGFVLEPEFDPGVPRLVAGHAIGTEATDMTMTPDAQRFISRVTDIGTPDGVRPRIEVILNWFDELKARVPTGR